MKTILLLFVCLSSLAEQPPSIPYFLPKSNAIINTNKASHRATIEKAQSKNALEKANHGNIIDKPKNTTDHKQQSSDK